MQHRRRGSPATVERLPRLLESAGDAPAQYPNPDEDE